MDKPTCRECKIYINDINKLKNDKAELTEKILLLQNKISLLNAELEEIKINNYDSVDEYFS